MKDLYKSKQGSVSIFLIIIFAAVFFFNAVLIDFARVMAFKKQSENAVKAAVRSVLSAYDMELQSLYGLYGLSSDDSEEVFYDTLLKNLNSSKGAFNYIDIKLDKDTTSMQEMYPLANNTVFKHQILEEMKYKAPVDIALDLTGRLNQFSEVMKDAERTTKVLDDLNSLYENRQETMKEIYQNLNQNIKTVKGNSDFQELKNYLYEYSGYLQNKKQLAILLNKLNSDSEQKDENLEKKIKKLKEEISEYETNFREEINNIQKEYEEDRKQHNKLSADTIALLTEARELNEGIKNKIDNYEKTNKNKDFNELLKKDDLVLPDSFFNELADIINKQKNSYPELLEKIKLIKSAVDSALSTGDNENNNTFNRLETAINNAQRIRSGYLEETSEIDKSKDELEKSLETANKKAEEINKENGAEKINVIIDLLKKAGQKNEDYQKLESYYLKYIESNKLIGQENDSINFDTENAEDNIDDLFADIGNLLLDFRDDLYVNEYVFNRFNSFDLQKLNDFIKVSYDEEDDEKDDEKVVDKIETTGDNILDLLAVDNQEIEYVIYGSHFPGKNVSAALDDIFLIRLAVNTVEGFLDPYVRSLTHPLAILVGAIIYGVAHAILDMIRLIEGKEVLFSEKFIKVKFGYRDYLRLLFLFHSKDSTKLARVQALISYHTGKDLTQITTYIKGNTSVSIELWFLPQVFKALDITGVINGNIEGKNYKITKTAVMSY